MYIDWPALYEDMVKTGEKATRNSLILENMSAANIPDTATIIS